MALTKKLFLGLLLCQSALLYSYPPTNGPLVIDGKSVLMTALLAGAQYFRSNPPATNASDSEKKMYRNVRLGIGTLSAAAFSFIPDHTTRTVMTCAGIGVGELARVFTSSNANEDIRWKEALTYSAIIAGTSFAMNLAKDAIVIRL